MNIKKEVHEKCVKMFEKELRDNHLKLRNNKLQINKLAQEQRVLKAQTGKIYELLNEFKKS